jgi:hypothetical protein
MTTTKQTTQKQTYLTRVMTARDHRLVDAMEGDPRYRKIAAMLRPAQPVQKAAPKPQAAPPAASTAPAAKQAEPVAKPAQDPPQAEPKADAKPGDKTEAMTTKNTGLTPKTSER